MPTQNLKQDHLVQLLQKWNITPTDDQRIRFDPEFNKGDMIRYISQNFYHQLKENPEDKASQIGAELFSLLEFDRFSEALQKRQQALNEAFASATQRSKLSKTFKASEKIEEEDKELKNIQEAISYFIVNPPKSEIQAKFTGISAAKIQALEQAAYVALDAAIKALAKKNMNLANKNIKTLNETLGYKSALDSFERSNLKVIETAKVLIQKIKDKEIVGTNEILSEIRINKTEIQSTLETLNAKPIILAETFSIPGEDLTVLEAKIQELKRDLNTALTDLTQVETSTLDFEKNLAYFVRSIHDAQNNGIDTIFMASKFGQFLQSSFPDKNFAAIKKELEPFVEKFKNLPTPAVENLIGAEGGIREFSMNIDVNESDESKMSLQMRLSLLHGLFSFNYLLGEKRMEQAINEYQGRDGIHDVMDKNAIKAKDFIENGVLVLQKFENQIKKLQQELNSTPVSTPRSSFDKAFKSADKIAEEDKELKNIRASIDYFIKNPPTFEILEKFKITPNSKITELTQSTYAALDAAVKAFTSKNIKLAKQELRKIQDVLGVTAQVIDASKELIQEIESKNIVDPKLIFSKIEQRKAELSAQLALLGQNDQVVKSPGRSAQVSPVTDKDFSGLYIGPEQRKKDLNSLLTYLDHLAVVSTPNTVGHILMTQLQSADVVQRKNVMESMLEIAGFRNAAYRDFRAQKDFIFSIFKKFPELGADKINNLVTVFENFSKNEKNEELKSNLKSEIEVRLQEINSRLDDLVQSPNLMSDKDDAKWINIVAKLCSSPAGKPGDLFAAVLDPAKKIADNPDVLQVASALSAFDMNQTRWISGKAGGANKPGEFGANYIAPYFSDRIHVSTEFIKQATDNDKPNQQENIAESLSAGILNSIIRDQAAPINLTLAPETKEKEAKASDRIYISSVFLPEYKSTFDRVCTFLKDLAPSSRKAKGSKAKIRNGLNELIAGMDEPAEIKKSMGKALMARMLVGDFQGHTENTGFALCDDGKGNKKTRFVILDFGGAFRRQYTTTYLKNPMTGGRTITVPRLLGGGTEPVEKGRFERSFDPTTTAGRKHARAYFMDYPKAIIQSGEFLQGVDEVANFSRLDLKKSVEERVDFLVKNYGKECFANEFAKELDTRDPKKDGRDKENSRYSEDLRNAETAANTTKNFLLEALIARQYSVKQYALETRFASLATNEAVELGLKNPVYFLMNARDPGLSFDQLGFHLRTEAQHDDMMKLLDDQILKINKNDKDNSLDDLVNKFSQRLNAARSFLTNLAPGEIAKVKLEKNELEELKVFDAFLVNMIDDYGPQEKNIIAMACDEVYHRLTNLYTKISDDKLKELFLEKQNELTILHESHRAYQDNDKPAEREISVSKIPDATPAHSRQVSFSGGIASSPVHSRQGSISEDMAPRPLASPTVFPINKANLADDPNHIHDSPVFPLEEEKEQEVKEIKEATKAKEAQEAKKVKEAKEAQEAKQVKKVKEVKEVKSRDSLQEPLLPKSRASIPEAKPFWSAITDPISSLFNRNQEEIKEDPSPVLKTYFDYAKNVSKYFKEDRAAQQSFSMFAKSRVVTEASEPQKTLVQKFIDKMHKDLRSAEFEISVPLGVLRSEKLTEKDFQAKYAKIAKLATEANIEAKFSAPKKTRTLLDDQYAVNYLINEKDKKLPPPEIRAKIQSAACYVEHRKGKNYRIAAARLPKDVSHALTPAGLPADEYLKYVDRQIHSFIAEVGSHRTVHIIESNKDQRLIESYILICKAKGLRVENHTNFNFTPTSQQLAAIQQKISDPARGIEGILLPKPKLGGDISRLVNELQVKLQTEPDDVKDLVKPLMQQINVGDIPLPNELEKTLQQIEDKLRERKTSSYAPPPSALK